MSPKRLASRGPRTVLLVLALSGLASSGCLVAGLTAAAAGGGAAYVYLRGRVSTEFPATFQDAHAAVLTSLRELALPLDKNEHNGITGTVLSRTGDGTVITIDLETQSSRVPADGPITRVGVRVGTFGDQATSERILGQVNAHLVQKTAPVPAPGTPGAGLGPIQPMTWNAPRTTAPPETSPPPTLPTEPLRVPGTVPSPTSPGAPIPSPSTKLPGG